MINNVSLTGRLTKDIMVKPAGQGQLGMFTLAVDQNFKNRNGQTGTDFINCHVWNKRAQVMAQYLHKGSLIGVTGAIRSGQYTNQQGQKVFTTYVEIAGFTFLDSRNNNGGNGAPAGNPNPNPNNNRFHPNPNQQPNGPAPQQPNNAGNNGPQNSNNPTPPQQNNNNNQPANSGNANNNGGNNNAPQGNGNANGGNNNPSGNNNGSGSNNNGSGFSNGHLPF